MNTALAGTGTFSLSPQNLDEAMRMADLMANSEMVPKDYQKKPGNVLIAVQMGAELGLKPVQSLQGIAVINGRPAVWGDALRALILSAPDLITVKDTFDDSSMTARCSIVRSINGNQTEFIGEFSQADAQAAGLWGRNTWKQYPKKMLEWRAFGFAARKAYADRLKGIQLAEEVRDITPIKEMGSAEVVQAFYSQEDFDKNFPKWEKAVLDGVKTPSEIIGMVSSKAALSEDQKKQVNAIGESQ